MEEIKRIEEILNNAQNCPSCDNSGFTVIQTSERQYVTRDMASDACDMSLEGSLYSEDEFEQEQCQWCYETENSKFNLAQSILQYTEKRIAEALQECNVYEDFDGDKVVRVSDIKKVFQIKEFDDEIR